MGYSPWVAKTQTRLSDFTFTLLNMGFLGGSGGKESACNAGDLGLSPGLGSFPGGRHRTHSSVLVWRLLYMVGIGCVYCLCWRLTFPLNPYFCLFYCPQIASKYFLLESV